MLNFFGPLHRSARIFILFSSDFHFFVLSASEHQPAFSIPCFSARGLCAIFSLTLARSLSHTHTHAVLCMVRAPRRLEVIRCPRAAALTQCFPTPSLDLQETHTHTHTLLKRNRETTSCLRICRPSQPPMLHRRLSILARPVGRCSRRIFSTLDFFERARTRSSRASFFFFYSPAGRPIALHSLALAHAASRG